MDHSPRGRRGFMWLKNQDEPLTFNRISLKAGKHIGRRRMLRKEIEDRLTLEQQQAIDSTAPIQPSREFGLLDHALSRGHLGQLRHSAHVPRHVGKHPARPKFRSTACFTSDEGDMSDLPRTTDALRSDIDSAKTGDKIDFPDPAMVPLGTDDEAAGTPPTAAQIRAAAEAEVSPVRRRRDANRQSVEGFPWPYLAIIVPLIVIILGVIWVAVGQRAG